MRIVSRAIKKLLPYILIITGILILAVYGDKEHSMNVSNTEIVETVTSNN